MSTRRPPDRARPRPQPLITHSDPEPSSITPPVRSTRSRASRRLPATAASSSPPSSSAPSPDRSSPSKPQPDGFVTVVRKTRSSRNSVRRPLTASPFDTDSSSAPSSRSPSPKPAHKPILPKANTPSPKKAFVKATSSSQPKKAFSKATKNQPKTASVHTTQQPTAPQKPATTGNAAPVPGTSNQITINKHTIGEDNPIHFKGVLTRFLNKITPPQQNYSFRKKSTLLTFPSAQDAKAFMAAVPASPTFGPEASYAHYTRVVPNPKSGNNRSPLQHVVLRGVHLSITEEELLTSLDNPNPCGCQKGFFRARRILIGDAQPTGLVRLFTACQACCAEALQEGVSVVGRAYKVEAPRNMLIRPCFKCHEYGHSSDHCSHKPKCRVCGITAVTGTKCTHEGHDHSKPYCCTCNKYGHYTGQRACPLYPSNPDHQGSQPIKFIPAPAPATNPWNMRVQDFPAIAKATPPPAAVVTQQPAKAPAAQQSKPTSAPQSQYVTLDGLQAFLEPLLQAISEGFKQTFDALLAVLISTIPTNHHKKVREAANKFTKTAFDARTIFQTVGSAVTVLHSKAKR